MSEKITLHVPSSFRCDGMLEQYIGKRLKIRCFLAKDNLNKVNNCKRKTFWLGFTRFFCVYILILEKKILDKLLSIPTGFFWFFFKLQIQQKIGLRSGNYVIEPNAHIVCVPRGLCLTYFCSVNGKDGCQKSQEYQGAPAYYTLK